MYAQSPITFIKKPEKAPEQILTSDNTPVNTPGNTPYYNPYTGGPITLAEADFMYKENARLQANIAKEQLRYEHKKALENLKLENSLKRDEAIAKRKYQREMASMGIVEDFEGSLMTHLVFPCGDEMISPPILNVKYVKMRIVHSSEDSSDSVQIVTWNDGSQRAILLGKDQSPEGLIKQLEKKGVTFFVGRDRKKMIADMLFAFLFERADHDIVPQKLGWNKVRGEWLFAFDTSETMEGIKKGENYEGGEFKDSYSEVARN